LLLLLCSPCRPATTSFPSCSMDGQRSATAHLLIRSPPHEDSCITFENPTRSTKRKENVSVLLKRQESKQEGQQVAGIMFPASSCSFCLLTMIVFFPGASLDRSKSDWYFKSLAVCYYWLVAEWTGAAPEVSYTEMIFVVGHALSLLMFVLVCWCVGVTFVNFLYNCAAMI
jgi:hypothetical protein